MIDYIPNESQAELSENLGQGDLEKEKRSEWNVIRIVVECFYKVSRFGLAVRR